MDLYERLNHAGMRLTSDEREALGEMEAVCRRLGTKYDDDDLLELADQCHALSAPIVVTRTRQP